MGSSQAQEKPEKKPETLQAQRTAMDDLEDRASKLRMHTANGSLNRCYTSALMSIPG